MIYYINYLNEFKLAKDEIELNIGQFNEVSILQCRSCILLNRRGSD